MSRCEFLWLVVRLRIVHVLLVRLCRLVETGINEAEARVDDAVDLRAATLHDQEEADHEAEE